MAEIRLNKIIRQFNVGLDDLVGFLHKIGVEVEANPNGKISEEYMPAIRRQFGKDLELKQAAEKVDIKITEIIEKTSRKPKKDEDEEEIEKETIIKSNTFINSKKEQPAPKPVEEPAPVEVKPVEPVKAEPVKVEAAPVAEPVETEPHKEVSPVSEPAARK